MRIFLIQSYTYGRDNLVYPVGIVNIGTILKKENHTVSLCDLNLLGENYMPQIEEMVSKFRPDLIGLSIRNIDSTHESRVRFFYEYIPSLIKVIKKSAENALLIAGGPGFSLFAKEIMHENPDIDFGIIGEGETVILKVLLNLDNIRSVENIVYRKDNEIFFTSRTFKNEIFEYISPDYSLLSPSLYHKKGDYRIGIETKRGCPLRCSYCSYPYLNGHIFRFRKKELVLNDIKTLYYAYNIDSFAFIDSIFNQPSKYSIELVNDLIALDLPLKWAAWYSEKGMTLKFARLCHKAGCRAWVFSPDGYSKETLIALKKGIKTIEINKIPDIMKELKDISVIINFFRFPPGQDIRGFTGLILFNIKTRLRLKGKLKGIGLSRIRIEPHTDIYKRAVNEGSLSEGANVLRPVYYQNRKMAVFEKLFNALTATKNFLMDALKIN